MMLFCLNLGVYILIINYEDLYQLVNKVVDQFTQSESCKDELSFSIHANTSCEVKNKNNGKKLVLMLGRFGDEYKVGFALYQPDSYGAYAQPEWIEDIFNYNFDETFMTTLMTEHLFEREASGTRW